MKNTEYDAGLFLHDTQKLICDDSPKIVAMLPQQLDVIVENDIWKRWPNGSGRPFETFAQAALAPQPWGLGLGQFNQWIRPSQLDALCTGWDRVRLALRPVVGELSQQVAKPGRPKKPKPWEEKGADRPHLRGKRSSDDPEYLLRRLKAVAPEVYAEWESGKYASVRAAAIAGGVVNPKRGGRPLKSEEDPVEMVKRYWLRADSEQRATIRTWMRTKEATEATEAT